MTRSIVLVGLPGSGKTKVAQELADRLDRPFVDTDHRIELESGTSIATVLESEGTQRFRTRERSAVAESIKIDGAIIGTGGGTVLDPANVADLRSVGTVVYLRIEPAVAAARLSADIERPLLVGQEAVEGLRLLLSEREVAYRAAAHCEVDASGAPQEVAEAILEALGLLVEEHL